MMVTAMWKAAMRQKIRRLFWLLLAKCPFSEKTFDWNFVPLPVFARS